MTLRTHRTRFSRLRAAQWAPLGALAALTYLRVLRPWQLHWGATSDEQASQMSGDELVSDPHLVATRAIGITVPPQDVWPWLVQIGRGRAGWYSYDRLDNRGEPSARRLIPEHQHMAVGDVVVMQDNDGEPFGPVVLALDPPRSMLWGDPAEPHRFTWQWLLLDDGSGGTRLLSRIRYRFSWRDPITGLLMELVDPAMMIKCLKGIRERAESIAAEPARHEMATAR